LIYWFSLVLLYDAVLNPPPRTTLLYETPMPPFAARETAFRPTLST